MVGSVRLCTDPILGAEVDAEQVGCPQGIERGWVFESAQLLLDGHSILHAVSAFDRKLGTAVIPHKEGR